MMNVMSGEMYVTRWLYFPQMLLQIWSLTLPDRGLFCDWMMWEVLVV